MKTTRNATLSSPWTYFAATYAWTWGLCALLIFTGLRGTPSLAMAVLVLAMVGPGVTGVLFNRLTRSREERRGYWRRALDPRRISAAWLVVVVALPFILQLLAGLIDGLAGGTGLRWGEAGPAFLADPAGQVLTLFVLSLVPLLEEIGWRGYALGRLQESRHAVKSSLILGGVWSLWHLPASFIPETYQAGLGVGTLEFWLHFIGIVALSVVVTWIYINARRSVLVLVIFHAMVNLAGELIALSPGGETVYTVCWVAAAVGIVLAFGRTMRVERAVAPRPARRPTGIFTLILAGLVLAATATGGAAGAAPDLDAGFRSELEALRVRYDLPGVTAAFILPDGTVSVAAAGLADVELGLPMLPDSRMLAASVGKTFVAAAVLSLAQEGVLDLDVPVSEWLGDRTWFPRLPNHGAITLRHLLTHASGVGNHVEEESFAAAWSENRLAAAGPMAPEDLIALVLDREPLFPAGEGWRYSDTGYLLAGLAVESVTGQGCFATIERRFLDPLGLVLTGPSDRPDLPGLAAGYMSPDNEFGLPAKTTLSPGVMAWDPVIEGAGGGLVSNPKDLVVWAKALFEGRAMADGYMQTLLRSVPIGDDDPGVRYALGVGIHEDGPLGPSYGHGGWIPGYCSSLRYYPAYGVAVAFQVNTDIGDDGSTSFVGDMELRLARVVVEALETEPGAGD